MAACAWLGAATVVATFAGKIFALAGQHESIVVKTLAMSGSSKNRPRAQFPPQG
jgi:hypothetical protein